MYRSTLLHTSGVDLCENKVDGDSDALSVSLRLPEGGSCDPTDGVDSAFSRQSWGAMPASLANPGGLQAAPDCMTQGPRAQIAFASTLASLARLR